MTPVTLGTNLANIMLVMAVSRKHIGPIRFRDLLSIGAIFSGIFVSVIVVLGGVFASLGG